MLFNKKLKTCLYGVVVMSTITTPLLQTVQADSKIGQITTDNKVSVDSLLGEVNNIDRSSTADLSKMIDKLQKKYDELSTENKNLKDEIALNEKELQKIANDVITRLKKLNEQAVSMQTDSNKSILDAVVSAESFSDMIQKVTAMSTLSSANNEIITELSKKRDFLLKKQKINQEKINKINENSKKLVEIELNLEVMKQEVIASKGENNAEALKIARDNLTKLKNGYETIKNTNLSDTNLKPNYDNALTYPVGQCTWGCKVLLPWIGEYWGNANQWGTSAEADGHKLGNTPKVGSIIVWPNESGGYGHVAVVSKVYDNETIEVLEANYGGSAYASDPRGLQNYRGVFKWQGSGGGGVYFIYE